MIETTLIAVYRYSLKVSLYYSNNNRDIYIYMKLIRIIFCPTFQFQLLPDQEILGVVFLMTDQFSEAHLPM